MICQTPISRMVTAQTNSLHTIAYEPHRELNGPGVAACSKRLLSLTPLAVQLMLVVAFTAAVAVGQITSATDGGIPSGLSQGSQSQDLDYVSSYNGHLTFRLPLLTIRGRGAGVSINLVRNSSHWVVEKNQDRNHITYNPRPDLNGKALRLPFYDPARLYVQNSVNANALCLNFQNGFPATTLRRFILITADGEEHELRDQGYDGQPLTYNYSSGNGAARGTIFRSTDGSDLTFISDAPVSDVCSNSRSESGTGYLLFPDGTRYHFVDGLLQTVRDRNGDILTFTFGTDLNDLRTYRRLTGITDSLKRFISISYSDVGIVNPAVLLYDQITYKGFGGNQRTIKVWYSDLAQALRANYTLQTYNCLFPALNSSWVCGGSSGNTIYTANVVNKVELPDGQVYRLYYNPYRELARVEIPTGAAVEYDYSPQNPDYSTVKTITRRVAERRVFVNASDTSPALRQVYSSATTVDQSVTPAVFTTTSTVEYRNPTNLLFSEQHKFHGAGDSKTLIGVPPTYKAWDEGLKFQTDVFDSNGTLLRTVLDTWQQRAHVNWWPQPNTQNSQANEPTQDPRIVQTDVVLGDTNQVSRKIFVYSNDLHNNLSEVLEYDFGAGGPGLLVRRTHTDFLTLNPVNNINYADPANGQSYTLSDPHLRSLPKQTSTYDFGGNERARITYEYDNYANDGNHAPLVDCPSISGLDSSFTPSYKTRGNVTKTTNWILSSATELNSYLQYDIAGNVLKAIDARGYATIYEFFDHFGSPDGEARANQPPAELAAQSSYAFPTKIRNPRNHTGYVQFDYYVGKPVDAEDANGSVISTYFDDLLDRPTQVRRAAGSLITNQTTFDYDDLNRTITVSSDLNTNNDNVLVRKAVYDGLGRTTETRQYEGGDNYIVTVQQYDSLGRIFKVSNPYRPWQNETALWTTTSFDALGRTINVTTPDNAVATSVYLGNSITVTDQTGKKRKTVLDALGRLRQVYEAPNDPNFNHLTSYEYDVLGNVVSVAQGSQQRFYMYDSMSRLIRARNPEQDINPNLNLTDPITNNSAWSTASDYDNNGNLLHETDARGIVITYSYDELNRKTSIDYSDTTGINPDVTRVYDGATNGLGRFWESYAGGTATSGSNVEHTKITGYDALGRPQGLIQEFKANGVWSSPYQISRNYDLNNGVTSQIYPSGRSVTYNYDVAGRLADKDAQNLAFTGSLGDGVLRTYSKGITYTSAGQLKQEQFGTTTSVYNKLFYNSRRQLAEILASTTGGDSSWNRGKVLNQFSLQCSGAGCNATDNNGNLRKQEVYIPNDDQVSGWTTWYQQYDYDPLNRLQRVHEYTGDTNKDWQQEYDYDRFGNRRISQGGTTQGGSINRLDTAISAATNRLYALGETDQNHTLIDYDLAGNQKKDYYSIPGKSYDRTYDAENRMATSTVSFSGGGSEVSTYSYDASGNRVRRKIGTVETWQVYGFGGELLAEYPANGAANNPAKEYGYRSGQLLITAAAGSSGWGTPPTFQENPLMIGATPIRSVHITELRSAIDAVRSHFNLGPYSWQAAAAPGDWITTAPIQEMQTALDQALGAPAGGYAAGLAAGQLVLKVHIQELRDRVLAAWQSGGGAVDIRWLITDQLGTPRMVFDQGGSLANVKRHDYLPFGEELTNQGLRTPAKGYGAIDGIRQKFTSQERDDETQLDYFGSRYYASLHGRFTSADEFGGIVFSPQTLNRYAYAGNNPLRFKDPTGHAAQDTHQTQDPQGRPAGTAPPCWPNCGLLPGQLPVFNETVTVGFDPNSPIETTDVQIVTELQIRTGLENPLPEKGAYMTVLDWLLGSQNGNVAMGTVAVGTAETGGTAGAAAGVAVSTAVFGAFVYDLVRAIGQSIADAIPTTPEEDPPNTIILYRGANATNPGEFRIDDDGVSAWELPPPGYKYVLPIQAMYLGQKVPGTVATIIEPGLTGGRAVYTPQFGPGHWSLTFPGKSADQIKKTLSDFAKAFVKNK